MPNKGDTYIPEDMVIKLKCPRPTCGHVWDYDGKSKFITSCPVCKTSVTIAKNEVKEGATKKK